MFSKASSAPTAWSESACIDIAEDEDSSVIGDAATIVGDLSSEGEIEVQGTVEGNIRSRRVKVGEGGQVHGEIVAEAVDIRGLVEGPIVAAIVYYIQTNNGTVRIEVLDETLQVTIDGQTVTMKERNKQPIKLRPFRLSRRRIRG